MRDIYADRVLSLPDWESLDAGRGEQALRKASARLRHLGDEEGSAILQVALARFLGHRGFTDRARTQLRRAEKAWPLLMPVTQLEGARRWMEEATAAPLPPSLRRRGARLLSAVLRRVR